MPETNDTPVDPRVAFAEEMPPFGPNAIILQEEEAAKLLDQLLGTQTESPEK